MRLILTFAILFATPIHANAARYFEIQTLDQHTGVPLAGVELKTSHGLKFVSDSNGKIAFYEPGLMGMGVFFYVSRNGYSITPDINGLAGRSLFAAEGAVAQIQLARTINPPPASTYPPSTEHTQLLQLPEVPRGTHRYRIAVVDSQTQRPIPLIFVTTPEKTEITDSGGWVGYHSLNGMSVPTVFTFSGHGYETQQLTLTPNPGWIKAILMNRKNIAQRLYRITGQGIYRQSALINQPVPLAKPNLNGKVLGQDSVVSTVYQGKVFWIWGDTFLADFPHFISHVTGATSLLPSQGGLDPNDGVDLQYFSDSYGSARKMTEIPGRGATWISALTTATDADGNEKLLAPYVKAVGLEIVGSGIAQFDDSTQTFYAAGGGGSPLIGSAYHVKHGTNDYVYFGPHVRVPAKVAKVLNRNEYETYTPYLQGSDSKLDRDTEGFLKYSWKKNTPFPTSGLLPEENIYAHMQDLDTGDKPKIHSIYPTGLWNPFRKRFVSVFNQVEGGAANSYLGEIWTAEADSPMGPWIYAKKVVTHTKYSFYNVFQHPFFHQNEGRQIFFEGTFTQFFSGAPAAVPREDYNQFMYKLDLTDSRLNFPVPFYEASLDLIPNRYYKKTDLPFLDRDLEAPFLVLDRPKPEAIPVYLVNFVNNSMTFGLQPKSSGQEPYFYCMPSNMQNPPANLTPLYEYTSKTYPNKPAYMIRPTWYRVSYQRTAQPLCLVWKNPMRLKFPVTRYLQP